MVLIKDLGMQPNAKGNKYRVGLYLCEQCRKEIELYTHNVKRSEKKAEEEGREVYCQTCTLIDRNTIHGKSNSIAYRKYLAMLSRCYGDNTTNFRWKGRGIKVCDEWLNSFEVFEEWFNSQEYKDGYELDRKNNDGNYEPGNCRLVPKYINARNRRDSTTKHSKYRYVTWRKDKGKWGVLVPTTKGKRTFLGLFEDEEDAYAAIQEYDNALDGLIETEEK